MARKGDNESVHTDLGVVLDYGDGQRMTRGGEDVNVHSPVADPGESGTHLVTCPLTPRK